MAATLARRIDPNDELLQPQNFLQPTNALYSSFIDLAKRFLDPLANDVTEAQLQRQKAERQSRKRKRNSRHDGIYNNELLKLRRLYAEGFQVEQVWQQAKRVLGAATDEVECHIPDQAAEDTVSDIEKKGDDNQNQGKTVHFKDDAGTDESDNETTVENGGSADLGVNEILNGEAVQNVNDNPGSFEDDSFEDESKSDKSEDHEIPQEKFVKDAYGLNDGFFSIDQFNKTSQFLERVDARGDPNDGAASDEEDIDWEVDPLQVASNLRPPRKTDVDGGLEPDEDEYGEEDGPTFGNADLNGSDGESIDENLDEATEVGGLTDLSNTNDILYADFFEAPPRQAGRKERNSEREKSRRTANNKECKDQPAGLMKEHRYERPESSTKGKSSINHDANALNDVERTMANVDRDLFDDGLSDDKGDEISGQDNTNLSRHERAQLALRAQIQRLELENVSAKPWSLTGEAVSQDRPLNSLLEEDLDYQRAGKPVPVITAEVNESIEELIKRRILARDFDEVIRRRPTDLVTGTARRGQLRDELFDTKPARGLAEEYEHDHLRRTDPNYVDTRSEELKKKHKEIEDHWAAISTQLDALCNYHYKPRPPAISVNTRVDVPTVVMEDIRPTAGGEVAGASILAPQEVYTPGVEGKRNDEVITRGGTAVAKEEESRETKRRRRRRVKERASKAAGTIVMDGRSAKKGSKTEKGAVIAQLKKGAVKVISSKGELKDVDGRDVKQADIRKGGAAFKL